MCYATVICNTRSDNNHYPMMPPRILRLRLPTLMEHALVCRDGGGPGLNLTEICILM